MEFIIQQSLKLVESGLVPDQAIRTAIRALSKKTFNSGRSLRPRASGTALYGCAHHA